MIVDGGRAIGMVELVFAAHCLSCLPGLGYA
jgi:hypothetical protein